MTETEGMERELARIEAATAMPRGRAPPRDCGHFNIHIDRDGSWFYCGTPINRTALVRLFGAALERDESGAYWLATPAERGRITVDDAPFIAVEVESSGEGRKQALTLRTNVDDLVTVDADHPLRIATDTATGTPRPYILVRNRLEARLARPVFYALVELGREERIDGTIRFGVWSKGTFFAGRSPGNGLTRAVIRERLHGRSIGQRGNGSAAGDHIRAAVLVPLVEREEGWFVLLTLRSADLADHAGQISLPGGRTEPEDADAAATALREAEEEIGLPRAYVDLAGRLDTWFTGTGFEVTPIVGLVQPPPPLVPDPVEVAEIFEVPLDFILDKRNHQWRSRELRGEQRFFWAIPYLHRNIWGVTAGMLVNLAEALCD